MSKNLFSILPVALLVISNLASAQNTKTIQCAWSDPYTYGNAQIEVTPEYVDVTLHGSQLAFPHKLIKLPPSPWLEVDGIQFTLDSKRCHTTDPAKSALLVDCMGLHQPLSVNVLAPNGAIYGKAELYVSFETLLARISSLDKWKEGNRVLAHIVLRDKKLIPVADERLVFEPGQCTVK